MDRGVIGHTVGPEELSRLLLPSVGVVWFVMPVPGTIPLSIEG